MSRETDMTEEKKILEFLCANGIKTLEQLKHIFRQCQNGTVDEDVVFVKEIKRDAATCISQEKLNMLIEASTRNKQILLDDLSKNTAKTSNPPPAVVQQSGTIDVPGRSIVNGCTKENVTSLPMRYRHKYTQQNHLYQKEKRWQQHRERYRQACQGNANHENIQYHHQQNNYHAHNQNTYEGVGQNVTGYNNESSHMMPTWPRGGGINSIGHTIPVAQPLVSTTVYNVVPQQHWPSATSMAHAGHIGYNNYAQLHLGPSSIPTTMHSVYGGKQTNI